EAAQEGDVADGRLTLEAVAAPRAPFHVGFDAHQGAGESGRNRRNQAWVETAGLNVRIERPREDGAAARRAPVRRLLPGQHELEVGDLPERLAANRAPVGIEALDVGDAVTGVGDLE